MMAMNIYTFPTNKTISSIKVESNGSYADFLFIISSPLPSFVIHCKNNSCFYTYSLIGKLIFSRIWIKFWNIFGSNYKRK